MIISTILSLIYANAISNNKTKSIFYSKITILSLVTAAIINYNNLYVTFINKGFSLYNGLLNISSVTMSFNLFIIIITILILIYNGFYAKAIIKTEKDLIQLNTEKQDIVPNGWNKDILEISEYSLTISFIVSGACILMSSGDLITLFISIELQSYGLYILSTLYKDSEQATWGGLTYYLLGGLSSCFILLGSCLIYINTGNTTLDGFYIITSLTEIANKGEWLHNNILNTYGSNIFNQDLTTLILFDNNYIEISLIILTVGLLFKISAAPFHFWSPDVYDAIPTTVTTYVALIAKLSILVILLEIVYYLDLNYIQDNINKSLYLSWKDLILLSSLLSLIIGSVLGLSQHRIKRLYAYSTISHVGFILLALSINRTESIQAYIFYILSYTISNLNAFMILVAIGYTLYYYTYNISHKNIFDITYSPIQLTSQLKGYFYINSYLALSLAITLFSFIGVPPLIGFFAKQMVLSAALDNGYIFLTLVGIITSVIAAAYYLNIIKIIFFFKSDYIINKPLTKDINKLISYSEIRHDNKKGLFRDFMYSILNKLISSEEKHNMYNMHRNYSINITNPLALIIAILTLLLLFFIFVPNEFISMTRILALLIFI